MKAVILAGGFGTRLSEETHLRPKPMVEIGGKPILWHILKYYTSYNITDFIICLGYKGYVIKEYFANYFLHSNDCTIDLSSNSLEYHNTNNEPWKISLVDTGQNSMTGGRLLAVKDYVGHETFCFTYGDGLSNVPLDQLIEFHHKHGKKASVTVQPSGRYGSLDINSEDNRITKFHEKPAGDGGWVNGGYFVLEPSVFDLIDNSDTVWEQTPLETLAMQQNLRAFKHNGFWQPMDTLRDKKYLESLWTENHAPWKLW